MRGFSSGPHVVATLDVQTWGMSTFWKALVVALLALPIGAYVTGTLVGSQADPPDRRAPIVVEDPGPSQSPTPSPTDRPSPSPTDRPSSGDDADDRDGDDDDDDDPDDDVEEVEPDIEDLDDDDGDDDDDRDG
jgi:hypothetical protein